MQESASPRRCAVVCLAIVLLTAIVYAPALHHPFINLDDDQYITANPNLTAGLTWASVRWAFTTGYACNWHPLTWLSHLLDVQLFGFNPAGHHFTNILFHAANAGLLFLVFWRLTKSLWPSAFVAALFAWHPLHVESVAWVAERKDVLSAFFFLLTLYAYVGYARAKIQTKSLNPQLSTLNYFLSLLFFACALMCKPTVVTLPFVLLLLDYWPLGRIANCGMRNAELKRCLVEKLPFFVLAVSASIITLCVQQGGGAVDAETPLGDRTANAVLSYARYIGKTVWPHNLAVFYPLPIAGPPTLVKILANGKRMMETHSVPWPTSRLVEASFLLVALTGAVIHFRRKPYLVVGWLWFLGMLVPMIGIVQVGAQALADRYTYIPLIGLFIMAAWGLNEWAGASARRQWFCAGVGVLILMACLVRTEFQLRYWRSSEALFRRAVELTSNNFIAANNLGVALLARGQYAEAELYLAKEIRLRPDALAYYNLGLALEGQDKLDAAIKCLSKAASLDTNYAEPENALGIAFNEQGKIEEARQSFTKAIKLKPDYPEACNRLGLVLNAQGKTNEALQSFARAVALDSNYSPARIDLAVALADQGKLQESIEHFHQAIRLDPGSADAHYDLATVFAALENTNEAIQEFKKAVQLKPSLMPAHNNLANLLADQGKFEEADDHFEAALKLNPDNPQIHFNFAVILTKQGKRREAIEHFSKVLQLDPNNLEARQQLDLLQKP